MSDRVTTSIVTFLFTDIEGSTRLLRRTGDRYPALLAEHRRMIREAVNDHGGREVGVEGDAFFCAFHTPADALGATLDAQRELHSHSWPADAEIKVRMGLHTGQVDRVGDDYFGLAVHQAARVADAAHGGQVLVSEATSELGAGMLPDRASLLPLGRYRLKDFDEPTSIYQLCHPELAAEFPALRLPAAHNVPETPNRFVDREQARHELTALVAEHRIVSIVGPGGVGKTRLATEAVGDVVPHFSDGVWLVELARLRDEQAVATEVAAIIGVRLDATGDARETLARALLGKQLLLILDNCEHVVDAAARLIEVIVGRCHDVHVLATSREPLGLRGEFRCPLAPLGLSVPGQPDVSAPPDAVVLFADRARMVAPRFDLEHEQAAVATICRRLDGLPLAIELAAARMASIPAVRIAERLDHRFAVLGRTRGGALSHHETLRSSIDWSYDLLDADEQLLMRRLGIFADRFELEAAERICGQIPLADGDVLDLLARLVEKSLVQSSGERYFLLESIREFAREQLQSVGELNELADRHLIHYTVAAEHAADEADGPAQRAAYDRLDMDFGDIRAAVEHALAQSNPAALRLAAALGQYGFVRNRLTEIAGWCIAAASAAVDAPPELRARALTQAGFAMVVMGSPDRGDALLDDALELARTSGDPHLLLETLLMAGDLRLEAGRPAQAQPIAREALELAQDAGDDWLRARALFVAAQTEQSDRDYLETRRLLSDALVLFEHAGDRRQAGRVLMMMAYRSLDAGELDAANRDAADCIAIAAELKHPIGEAMGRLVQVWTAIERGDAELARTLLAAANEAARNSGYRTLVALCVAARAGLYAMQERDAEAARVLGAALAAEDALGAEGGRAIRRRTQALRDDLQRRLTPDEYAALTRDGARQTLEDVVELPL